MVLDTTKLSAAEAAHNVILHLQNLGFIEPRRD
jgi:hypothetical protein